MALKISQYRQLINNGSLKAFYDDIVYWEMARNANRFYVTFMEGAYAINNGKQESIGTMEINYPHTNTGLNESTGSFNINNIGRTIASPRAFLQDQETGSGGTDIINSHQYNGFIPITELRGTRFFETTISSSNFSTREYHYELHDETVGNDNPGSLIIQRSVEASYHYPFSSYQLSVLREEPTVIINLAKESELFNGIGESGFIMIPANTHQKVRSNLEYYLEKAGLIDKTTKNKSPRRGR